MNTARRVTECESDAEDLVSDGFARAFCPDRAGSTDASLDASSMADPVDGPHNATTYSREAPDIVMCCAQSREQRSADDERRINSFVWRLTMTTRRHLWRTRAKEALRKGTLAEHQCAIVVLETVEDELCRWSNDDALVTRVLDDILTEISRKPEDKREALTDRLRSELDESEERPSNKEIAARHGMNPATLSSDWSRLLLGTFGKKKPC